VISRRVNVSKGIKHCLFQNVENNIIARHKWKTIKDITHKIKENTLITTKEYIERKNNITKRSET
jgi:hypothetical protein